MVWTVREVNPRKISLIDGLVHWQMQSGEQMIEAAIVGTVAHGNVGSLTLHVLARW